MTTSKTYDRVNQQKADLLRKLQDMEYNVADLLRQYQQGFGAKMIQNRALHLVTASVQMLEVIAEIVAQEQVISDAQDAGYQSEMAEMREAVANDWWKQESGKTRWNGSDFVPVT